MIKQTMTSGHDEAFAKALSEMSDRELQEEQTFIMWKAKKASESTYRFIFFLFWLTIIGFTTGIFLFLMATK